MRRPLLGIALFTLAATSSCGGAAPPPEAPTTPQPKVEDGNAAPGTRGAQVAADTFGDAKAGAEPADLIGIARWKNPAATLSSGAATAGMPAAVGEALSKLAIEEILGEMVRGVDAKKLVEVVSLDASVDAVLALDPSPRKKDVIGAVSVGLTSLERAKAAAEAAGGVSELGAGMWKIGKREHVGKTCVIATATGPAPARLVCGPREKDVVALAPYLARTLALQPPPANDIHAELRILPVIERHGGQLKPLLASLPALAQQTVSLGEPRFDRAVQDGAQGLADEAMLLLGDLDKVTVDASLTPAGFTATGALELRARKSWLAQTIAERPERAGAPPPIFWRAPKDSDTAFYSRGMDPARWTPILRTLRDLAGGALTKLKVGSQADRDALTDLIQIPLGKDTNTVSASGHIDPVASKGAASPQAVLDGLVDGYLGWRVIGFEEGPASLTKFLKDVVAVYNRASLLAPIKKELRADAKLLPTVKTVPAPKELGAGSLAVEIKVSGIPAKDLPMPDAKGGAKGTVSATVHVLLMSDGGRTWLALGANKPELVKHLLAAKSDAGEAGTLGARNGLDALKKGTTLSGGFLTLAIVTRSIPSMVEPMAMGLDPEARQVIQALANLPHKGETPILATGRSTPGPSGRTEVTLTVPKDALEDVASVAQTIMKMATKQRVAAP